MPTYSQEVTYLSQHAKVVELKGLGDARVAVVPAFQGRVMTSTATGPGGPGYGWINTAFIDRNTDDDPVFNNYGGEDRFWLGPEAGQFALWYKNGEPFDLAHWKTQPGFSKGPFKVTSQGAKSVAMTTQFEVVNYSGTKFDCALKRTVAVLTADQIAKYLGRAVPAGVASVAFESRNTLANAGIVPWTRPGGLVGIWILGMHKALPHGRVIVPFRTGDQAVLGSKATIDYFGVIPADRCKIEADHVWFACDGRFRSKIGVSPARAKDVFGSYDPDAGALTLVQYTLPASAARLPYVNSLWQIQEHPFAGDAINSYNDGLASGVRESGTFFELESSGPAAELKPGEAIKHVHRTFHFVGPRQALDEIARKVLGVSIA